MSNSNISAICIFTKDSSSWIIGEWLNVPNEWVIVDSEMDRLFTPTNCDDHFHRLAQPDNA